MIDVGSALNVSEELDLLNGSVIDESLRRDSLYVVVPVTVVYVLIFVTGILGNVVTCIVIARNKYMHTATNYYLFSLAVSDLLLLVTGLPQEVVSIWHNHPYLFGEAFCVLRGLAAEMSANATVLTITAFTVERYIAICHPFLSHTMSKLSRAVKIIVGIWVASLLFAAPHAAQVGVSGEGDNAMCHVKRTIIEHSFELSTFLFFVIPMTVITVLYALIGLKLRSTTSALKKESFCFYKTPQSREYNRRPNQCTAQTSRRVINMLAAVVVAFFVCWAPFHVQRLVAIYSVDENRFPKTDVMVSIYYVVTYVSGILYYLSATVNPILYHIMSLKFREAFKETIGRMCSYGEFQRPRRERCYSPIGRRATFNRYSNHHSHSTDNSGHSLQEDSSGSRILTENTSQLSRFSKRTKSSSLSDSGEGRGRSESFRCPMKAPYHNRASPTFSKKETEKKTNAPFSVILRLRPISPQHRRRKQLWGLFRRHNSRRMKAHYYIEAAAPYEMSLQGSQAVVLRSRRGATASSSISNSSLRDLDKAAMKDEFVFYVDKMKGDGHDL